MWRRWRQFRTLRWRLRRPLHRRQAGGGGGGAADGEAIFKSSCVSCHTLAAAGASGTIGPNLDDAQPNEALVRERVTNGMGVMPSFKDQLSQAEIAAVAKYVSENAGQ